MGSIGATAAGKIFSKITEKIYNEKFFFLLTSSIILIKIFLKNNSSKFQGATQSKTFLIPLERGYLTRRPEQYQKHLKKIFFSGEIL